VLDQLVTKISAAHIEAKCRFDIMWLILDRANEEQDRKLAEHVLTVHSVGAAPAPESELDPLTPQQLRTYIALAKQHSPCIPEDLTDYVAAIYAEMRRQETMSSRPQSYTTPRTLLSILRLSQSLAKLRFDNKVLSALILATIYTNINCLQICRS
jgi:DNA replication licensing factor MCM7